MLYISGTQCFHTWSIELCRPALKDPGCTKLGGLRLRSRGKVPAVKAKGLKIPMSVYMVGPGILCHILSSSKFCTMPLINGISVSYYFILSLSPFTVSKTAGLYSFSA
jgi:hypothetical protein